LVLRLVGGSRSQVLNVSAGSSQRLSQGVALLVLLTRLSRSGVKAPLGLEGLVDFLGLGELKVADLLGNGGALSNRVQLGDKLGLETAGLLRVQITGFLGNINKGGNDLIVALLSSFLSDTASSADLNGKLLALGVSNKLTRLLLNVLGGAGRLIDSTALLGTLTIADLLNGLVTFLHGFIESLLLEGDLARLLKVFFADLLLSGRELCDIGVVALLNILVCTLKDRILLQGLDSFFLFNTTKASLGVILASTEVDTSLNFNPILAAPSELLATVPAKLRSSVVSQSHGNHGQYDECLKMK
jgi:hypothetical protein